MQGCCQKNLIHIQKDLIHLPLIAFSIIMVKRIYLRFIYIEQRAIDSMLLNVYYIKAIRLQLTYEWHQVRGSYFYVMDFRLFKDYF